MQIYYVLENFLKQVAKTVIFCDFNFGEVFDSDDVMHKHIAHALCERGRHIATYIHT